MNTRSLLPALMPAVVVLSAGCGVIHLHHGPHKAFDLVDLKPLAGGKSSEVFDLSDGGVAVGRADYAGAHGHQHAVEWDPDKGPKDLDGHVGMGSEADRIGVDGSIVGWASTTTTRIDACRFGDAGGQFFFRNAKSMSVAVGIDKAGAIGVMWDGDGGEVHSTLADTNTASDIGAVPGYRDTMASAVSPTGLVVGTVDDGQGNKKAFQWSPGSTLQVLPPVSGSTNSYANAVNGAGVVAGSCSNGPAHFRAVIWRNGQPEALPSPSTKDSEAFAVNDKGDVVGTCNNHACLWRKGKLIDLNVVSGEHEHMVLNTAVAINKTGEIACNGFENNQIHAYLLTSSGS